MGTMDANGERQFDVIVVGSGIGGLAAALHAAVRGRRVLVLEAGKEIGGLVAPFRRGSYTFDTGLHYLGECGPGQAFTRALTTLGLADEIRFREIDPEGFDRLVFPGYEVAVPRGADRFRDRLARDFPAERRGLDAFFARLAAFHEAAAEALAQGPAAPAPPFFVEHARVTFGALLDACVRDPLLKAVLAAQGGNYALPPGRASALVGLSVMDHYLGGAWFPRGGSGAIRDAFARAVERRGGELRRGREVARILVRGGRVAGVRCRDGEAFEAPAVVSGVDAVTTCTELLGEGDLPARARDRAARARPSMGSVNLFVGTTLDPATAGMTDANVWHYAGIDLDRIYAPALRGELSDEDTFFLSAPSLKDPAPSGRHTLVLSTIVPYEPFAPWGDTRVGRRGPGYRELKRALVERWLACVERYVPGVSARAEVIELSTPLTTEAFTRARRGGMYGPEHTPDQVGPLRFPIAGTIPGLYLAGASTLGGGVVASALSGLFAGGLASGATAHSAAFLGPR